MVYDELRNLATVRMGGEGSEHTLQATALVHEAWLKLRGRDGEPLQWNDHRHFFNAAAEAMRRILIDHARRKNSERHGGRWIRITFGDYQAPSTATPAEIIDLDSALAKLARSSPEKAEIANMHLFGGLTLAEIAASLGVAEITVKRRWKFVKAWLTRELKRDLTKSEEP